MTMSAAIDFGKRTIIVSGTKVDLDCKTDLEVSFDLTDDMSKVASQMAWWASVWAEAEAERVRVDAAYRSWRGKKTVAIDPKQSMAEWRVKALIEADPEFVKHKNAIARTEGNVTAARGQHESFAKKANILQSRGAMERDERGATGMSTPESPRAMPSHSASRSFAGVSHGTSTARKVVVKSHKDKMSED